MDLIIDAVKLDLVLVLSTGRYLLASFFLLAVVLNYLGMIQGNTNWGALILRLVLGFVILQNYAWAMDTTRSIINGLDERINPEHSYVEQYAQMSTNMQQQFQDNTQQSLVSQATSFIFGKFTLHNLIINLSFIFYAILSKVMEAIRYCIVAIMYKLGPILIPLILFQSTGNIIRGWYTSYVSVLCWPILWHIVLSVAVAFSSMIGPGAEGIEQFTALNFSICFVLMFTPMIVAGIVAGIGGGGAAALAGVVFSRLVTNTINRAGHTGRNIIRNATSGFRPNDMGRRVSENRLTPTVTKGRFKETLLGLGRKTKDVNYERAGV